ncbi:MAG TPA: hypothetical protein VG712_05180, partial [Gemmatimonadales bacterium]|nr:hypothetical protein [Gemmatimonadales bacterium]
MSPLVPNTRYHVPLLVLLLLPGCQSTFLPLKNRITPGIDPFVVFVADGQADGGELWAGQASGGSVYQVTYTLSDEDAPALSPSGGVLAYTRAPSRADSLHRRVWVMNLVSGNEREFPPLPEGVIPTRLAFSADGATIYVRTTGGIWALQAPPSAPALQRLGGADSARADSVLTTYIGDPPFAAIGPCVVAAGSLCAFPPGQPEAPLQEGGFDPVHWGADSVGYFVGDRLLVRSGGGGRVREVMWSRVPPHPRRPTYAPAG